MGNKASKKNKKLEKQELQDAFKLFDKDGSGFITVDEFKELIYKLEGQVTDAVAQSFIKAADKNKDGKINFKEFRSLWDIMRGDTQGQAEIREAFEALDIDDNGYASKEEFAKVIRAKVNPREQKQVLESLNSCDVNNDGKISYPEFMIKWKFA